MGKASFKVEEITAIVRPWKNGGAYVPVPSAWAGEEVIVINTKATAARKKRCAEAYRGLAEKMSEELIAKMRVGKK